MRANPAGLATDCMIVANPAAGSVSESLVEEIAGHCARYVRSVRTFWTTRRGEATSEVDYAASRASQAGLLVVVAVGGDGTVLEVVRGMVRASGRGRGNQALFVVPAGTGNSNYRALWGELPWPEALDRALCTLPDSIARLDLAQVPELEDLVVLGAGAGLTAKVLMSARDIQLTGRARLAAALEHAAARFTPYEGRVTVDGTVLHKGGTVLANVGGGPYRAWQYTVLPHSLLDDGLLDVCVVSGDVCPAEVPGLLLTGAHVRVPGVFYGRGTCVVIERLDGAPLCFEHDGELIAGISPRYTVQVLPGALAALCGPVPPGGAELTPMATLIEELAGWAAALRPADIPDRVLDLAASQVLSQLAAIRAGQRHPLGRKLVCAFGPPAQPEARAAAVVLAGLGSWLNMDDTAYAGHLSNSTVAVPLAYAAALGLDGPALLTAVVAANECAARITAAATLGPFRGQTAAQTSLVGAAAGRLHCEGAPARQWVDAIGLALAAPPWTLLRGYIGSDARAFGAFGPVRTAMDACDAAAAGMTGAADILDHPDGFLTRFATVPLPEAVVAGLGQRWHTDTLSFKVRPGGPGIDAALDCAIELSAELPGLSPHEVADVLVEASRYTVYVSRKADEYVTGPGSAASALPLSVPYTVATALLRGGLAVADFAWPATGEPARWDLARRIRLTEDEEMTRALLTSDAPFGEALRQAGDRAKEWVRGFGGDRAVELLGSLGPPRQDFLTATKHTGARVTVRLTDGRTLVRQRGIPIGAAGPETRATHRAIVREKYLSVGGRPEIADGCLRLRDASPDHLAALLRAALADDLLAEQYAADDAGR